MKYIFTVLAIACAFSLSVSQTMDRSPFVSPEPFPSGQQVEGQWDLQFDYDASAVTGAAGNAAAVFIDIPAAGGPQFWTSRWASNVLHRWNPNGTLIEQFTITGVTGVRGLTFDGQYLYTSTNSATIHQIDPVTKTLVGTITCQGGVTTRVIVYDPVRDGFWVSNFADNLSCVNRSGAVIATIPATQLVAKYGGAYDRYTPGGPYMWIWDQTNTAGGIPQPIYQVNLNTLTFTGITFDILSRVTTGGATPIAGGLFITTGLVPSKVTIGGMLQGVPDRLWGLELGTSAADTVLPFNLQSPAPGTTITTLPGSATPVVISWDTNRVGVTFKWIFGTPIVPPRVVTIPSATNGINTTLGAVDAILAGLGVQQGDSVVGQWDVWAFRNNEPNFDSLKSSNGPRAITLKRGRPVLTAFGLVSPPTGSTIVTQSGVSTPVNFVWRKSGDGVTYRWKFSTPAFPGTIRLNVSTGFDTSATFSSSQLDSAVAAMGVLPGDSIVGQWRAYAYSGSDSLASTQTFNVTFKRALAFILPANPGPSNNGGATNYAIFLNLIATGTAPVEVNAMTSGNTAAANASFNVEVFTRTGNALGGPVGSGPGSSTAGWTSLGTVPATQGSVASGVSLLFSIPTIRINPGDTVGVALRFTGAGPRYFGTGTPPYTTYSDANLTLITGDSRSAPFTTTGSFFASRALVGEIHYTLATSDVKETGQGVPVTYVLSQNYPNPFNPSTTIKFAIPMKEHVTLKVYNTIGQIVATLHDGELNAGSFEATWNASNMASGVYFYRLQAGNFAQTKKLMLLK